MLFLTTLEGVTKDVSCLPVWLRAVLPGLWVALFEVKAELDLESSCPVLGLETGPSSYWQETQACLCLMADISSYCLYQPAY